MDATSLVSDSVLHWGGFVAALTVARVGLLHGFQALSHSKLAEKNRITKRPVISEKQHQRERVWPIGFALDAVVMVLAFYMGLFQNMPNFAWSGVVSQFVIHAVFVELAYYWLHRALHWRWLFKQWHQYHHASVSTEPKTSLSFEVTERLVYTLLFAVTPIGSYLLGYQSFGSLALHLLWFDVMNALGHINFEFLPAWWVWSPFNVLFYTASYHSIHHTRFNKNFALFMPWTDIMFGTADLYRARDVFHEAIGWEVAPLSTPLTPEELAPKDFGFAIHGLYVPSFLHSPHMLWCTNVMGNRYEMKWWMWPLYPYALIAVFVCSYFKGQHGYHVEEEFEKTTQKLDEFGNPTKLKGITFTMQTTAYDYFMPWKYLQLNARIGSIILEAQRRNVRVVGLAALNKAEWLNHGGVDIVNMLGDKLKTTCITHGDTLTAACVLQYALDLKRRNFWKNEVFMIGATSKIGRAIALALAKRQILVRMFTQSQERFEYIRDEAGENSHYLVRAASLEEGAESDFWITGKYKPDGYELMNAIPQGSTVLNFAVPDPLTEDVCKSRPDVLHLDGGYLAYDPKNSTMEFSHLLPKGTMYACMAGCVTHSAMGYTDHEIGPVRMDRLDPLWEKAVECGFFIPPPTSFSVPLDVPEYRFEEI